MAYALHSVMDQFCSAGWKMCKAMSLTSVVSVKSRVKSRNEIIGGEDSHYLIFLKALYALSVHSKSLLTLLILLIRAMKLANISVWTCSGNQVSRNWWIQTRHLMRLWSCLLFMGDFISMLACMYSGLGLNPSPFTMHPRNFTSVIRKVHLSGFRRSDKEMFKCEYIFLECPGPLLYIGRKSVW